MRRGGFSLVEMLVAALIAIMIFVVGFIMITGTVRARGESLSRVRATENARLFFQMLEKDLSAGYPGAFGMKKGVAPVPGTNPATLVLNEAAPIASDLIQFYTHNDLSVEDPANSNPNRMVFVRYYINQVEHTLCREVREDNASAPTGSIQMEMVYPPNTISTPDSHALFDDARQILIDFQYWDNATKTMIPVQWSGSDFRDGGGTPRNPTHVMIRLVLFDPYAEARLRNDPTAVSNPNLKYRAFTKTFPIPPGF